MRNCRFYLLIATIILLLTVFTGCSKEPEKIELAGDWVQSNGSKDAYHTAVITEDTIEIYWIMDGGETTALYWAGSVTKPEEGTESPYAWISSNDRSQTDMALLASTDDTKTFTYNKGEISYSASALGVTTTVRLEKIK